MEKIEAGESHVITKGYLKGMKCPYRTGRRKGFQVRDNVSYESKKWE